MITKTRFINLALLLVGLVIIWQVVSNARQYFYKTVSAIKPEMVYAEKENTRIFPDKKSETTYLNSKNIYDFINGDEPDLTKHKAQIIDEKIALSRKNKREYERIVVPRKPVAQAGSTIKFKDTNIKITKSHKYVPKRKAKGRKNMVQLGAFRSKQAALNHWVKLQSAYPSIMKNVQYYIARENVRDVGFLYKLKAGSFNSKKIAKRFCRDLRNEKLDCFYTSAAF
jgi:hypothetical protein